MAIVFLYVRRGGLDIRGLFKLLDCTAKVLEKQSCVKQNLDEFLKCVQYAEEPVLTLIFIVNTL